MTLDGIDKTYFNASADGLISDKPGILKLKKHPDSANQTVYIKTSKSQINLDDKVLKQPTFNVTDDASASAAAAGSVDWKKRSTANPQEIRRHQFRPIPHFPVFCLLFGVFIILTVGIDFSVYC